MKKTNLTPADRIKKANHICSDPNAMQDFYNNHINYIRAMVRSYSTLDVEAEDIFQEGFISVMKILLNKKFDGSSDFKSYFYKSCRNLCKKRSKKGKRMTPTEIDENTFIDEVKEYKKDLIQLMIKFKEKIKPICKEIIDLVHGLGSVKLKGNKDRVPFKEVANKIGISEDNARQRYRNCFRELKSQIFKVPDFQILKLSIQIKYNEDLIKSIIAGTYEVIDTERAKRKRALAVWKGMNDEIANLWVESEGFSGK
ncbi:MAG: sigma-70 family RNA polymerase sigma factor [Bacteroidales bacterium]|nr:sigma-70 family RNA polymerase sigma factor [Bacteroidales bacterium]